MSELRIRDVEVGVPKAMIDTAMRASSVPRSMENLFWKDVRNMLSLRLNVLYPLAKQRIVLSKGETRVYLGTTTTGPELAANTTRISKNVGVAVRFVQKQYESIAETYASNAKG